MRSRSPSLTPSPNATLKSQSRGLAVCQATVGARVTVSPDCGQSHTKASLAPPGEPRRSATSPGLEQAQVEDLVLVFPTILDSSQTQPDAGFRPGAACAWNWRFLSATPMPK